jgi:hypothetical protein
MPALLPLALDVCRPPRLELARFDSAGSYRRLAGFPWVSSAACAPELLHRFIQNAVMAGSVSQIQTDGQLGLLENLVPTRRHSVNPNLGRPNEWRWRNAQPRKRLVPAQCTKPRLSGFF